jgi:transcriptional regulator with XRE-family HTH domain
MKTHSQPEGNAVWGDELAVLQQAREVVRVPPGGWLRAGREAQGIPQKVLATKLGIQRQAWAQFEGSEARGAISLYSLRRAADALGYELVYFLVPKAPLAMSGAMAGESMAEAELGTGQPRAGAAGVRAERGATGGAERERGDWFAEELPTELR